MTTNRSSNRTINQNEMQHKTFTADITKSINDTKRTIDFIISNETPDRHGDIILLKGWDTKRFMENPVVLFAHSRSVPPIGKALKVWKSGGNLNATAQFMDKELSPFADSIFNMFKEGFLKAVSVGFMPEEFEFIRDDENEFITGVKFIKQELLEFSAVPIPSNPDALVKARHKGIDVEPIGKWAEEMLDDWANSGNMIRETYNIGKKQIELIRRKAIGETMTYQVPEEKQKELLKKNLKAADEFRAKEKEKEANKSSNGSTVFKLNRDAVAYANSLIEKNNVNLEDDLENISTETKEHLSIPVDDKSAIEPVCRIITADTLFRSAVIQAKQDSAFDSDGDVFNAASRLLKKIDGEKTFKVNEYEDWDKNIPIKEFDAKDFEEIDAMQHQDGDVKSIFFNNSPQELIIYDSLFKSSGGAISFTGNNDNLSIVFNGSNIDLNYYPYAKDESGSFICRLDSDITSIPNVVKTQTIEVDFNVNLEQYDNKIKEELNKEEIDLKIISEDKDEPKFGKVSLLLDGFEEKDDINTPMEQVNILDSILVDLEETLEKNPDLISSNNGDKRFIRKIKFVAQYMKDLANAISPVTTETTTTVEEGTIPVKFINKEDKGNDKEITEEDIDKYLLENLGPTLDKIIKTNLNKMQGRLD